MIIDDLYIDQEKKREDFLNLIIKSKNPYKLIVAGPGTGKTFTFKELFRNLPSQKNLALTFINRLVNDMHKSFGSYAEVKTFHAYCIKLLHSKKGTFQLRPFLTKIIEQDSVLLGYKFNDFDTKFQTLDEKSGEISFYLSRGDYYNVVSFNDSVYRLYKLIKNNGSHLPKLDQVVIDEFQDFNILEVSFIEELEKIAPILIVGDDDQAVYFRRNSSPFYIREKYNSGKYEIFELPFCSRCPRVIVEATSSFIDNVVKKGKFQSRIEKRFVPFIDSKKEENKKYPKIINVNTTTISVMTKYLISEINKIQKEDIEESYKNDYPCVLIVGKPQYLNPINKKISKVFVNVSYCESKENDYSLVDGYECLLRNINSNIGWRIIAEYFLTKKELRRIIVSTTKNEPMVDLIPKRIINKNKKILEILHKKSIDSKDKRRIRYFLKGKAEEIIQHNFFEKGIENKKIDKSEPTILLSSFEGCKGLSGGHVFIVGLNKGVVPQVDSSGEIKEIEFCKFIVALTRTQKQCHLISNRWDYTPSGRMYSPSQFISMIPNSLINDLGFVKSENIK